MIMGVTNSQPSLLGALRCCAKHRLARSEAQPCPRVGQGLSPSMQNGLMLSLQLCIHMICFPFLFCRDMGVYD